MRSPSARPPPRRQRTRRLRPNASRTTTSLIESPRDKKRQQGVRNRKTTSRHQRARNGFLTTYPLRCPHLRERQTCVTTIAKTNTDAGSGIGVGKRGVREVTVPTMFRYWPLVSVPVRSSCAPMLKSARLRLLGGLVESNVAR